MKEGRLGVKPHLDGERRLLHFPMRIKGFSPVGESSPFPPQSGGQRAEPPGSFSLVGRIVVLTMAGGEADHRDHLEALRARFDVVVVEPRWPECQDALAGVAAGLVVVDASHAPSHGRAVARWMAATTRFRTVPFLFLDVQDKDVARVTKDLPRAKFATWACVVSVSGRLLRA